MDGQQVRLGKRVVDLKDVGEVVQGLGSTLQCKLSLLLEASGGINTDWDTDAVVLALSHCLDVLEVTYSPGKEL